MATQSRNPELAASEPVVRYERQLSVASIGTLWLGRFIAGNEAGRPVLLRQIVKTFLTTKESELVRQGAQAYAKVRHPAFVKLLGAIEQNGDLLTLSEHLVGAPLFDVLRDAFDTDTPLPATVSVRIVLDAARATVKAHRLAAEAGLFPTERLFLPEGIFLAAFGGTLLSEVGTLSAIARCAGARSIPDVIAQLSPEELTPQGTSRSSPEVFSLGVLLWECLANRRLFSVENANRTRSELLTLPIPRLDSVERFGMPVPEPLVNLVRIATERNPSTRYETLEQFIAVLEQLPAHFVATEHQVAEMLRLQACSLVLRCLVDETATMTSGTFSEVPASRMSTRPPAKPNFDTEHPTFAQRQLVSSFTPLQLQATELPGLTKAVSADLDTPYGDAKPLDANSNGEAVLAHGIISSTPHAAASRSIIPSTVVPSQRRKPRLPLLAVLITAFALAIAVLFAITSKLAKHDNAARPETTKLSTVTSISASDTLTMPSANDARSSSSLSGAHNAGATASPVASSPRPNLVQDTQNQPEPVDVNHPAKSHLPRILVDEAKPPQRSTPPTSASVFRPTAISPYRPKGI